MQAHILTNDMSRIKNQHSLPLRAAITKVTAIILASIVVVAAVAAVLYYVMVVQAPAAPEVIKIGWPVPLTGPIASFGEPDPWVAQQIEQVVNRDGGVFLSAYNKKVPIKIIIRDTKSDPNFAATVAEELITREQVDLIVVLHTPGTTVPVSGVCERYKVPCIVYDTPVLAWLQGGPYEWSFLAFWTEVDVAQIFVGIWDKLGAKTNKVVAGIWSDDPDGRTFRELTIALAQARGYKVIDSGVVPYGTLDFSAYIREWKAQGAEILTGNLIPPDFATLWRQSRELGFIPKVATIGRSILFPSSVEALGGDLGIGLTTEVWVHKVSPFRSSLTGQTPRELAEEYERATGKQWSTPLIFSHAAFENAIDALKRAGSLDKEKIRDAIANTDLDTIVGHINFKRSLTEILTPEELELYKKYPALIQYQNSYSITPVIGGQWVKGTKWPYELEVVYNWKYDNIPETAELKTIPELLGTGG
jgi:branched-chain amino acid transport system substrate-binding protein